MVSVIKVTGRRINSMAKEFNFFQMEPNMREIFNLESNTVKVNALSRMVQSTMANGKTIR